MTGPIQPVSPVPMPAASGATSKPGAGGFQEALTGAIREVEARGADASLSIERFLSGEGELHTTALAAQRAEISFDLFLQTRNKVIQAYQEIMRMPM